jgi:hypothetical protein
LGQTAYCGLSWVNYFATKVHNAKFNPSEPKIFAPWAEKGQPPRGMRAP